MAFTPQEVDREKIRTGCKGARRAGVWQRAVCCWKSGCICGGKAGGQYAEEPGAFGAGRVHISRFIKVRGLRFGNPKQVPRKKERLVFAGSFQTWPELARYRERR